MEAHPQVSFKQPRHHNVDHDHQVLTCPILCIKSWHFRIIWFEKSEAQLISWNSEDGHLVSNLPSAQARIHLLRTIDCLGIVHFRRGTPLDGPAIKSEKRATYRTSKVKLTKCPKAESQRCLQARPWLTPRERSSLLDLTGSMIIALLQIDYENFYFEVKFIQSWHDGQYPRLLGTNTRLATTLDHLTFLFVEIVLFQPIESDESTMMSYHTCQMDVCTRAMCK